MRFNRTKINLNYTVLLMCQKLEVSVDSNY